MLFKAWSFAKPQMFRLCRRHNESVANELNAAIAQCLHSLKALRSRHIHADS